MLPSCPSSNNTPRSLSSNRRIALSRRGRKRAEEDRGFFFIEDGLMTIERDPNQASRNTMSLRAQYVPEENTPRMTRVDSIGHLNARALTRGKEDAKMKQLRRSERGLQNFRLARIGSGWVVGTIEGASGLKNSGVHVAVTECRLHLLPFARVKEIEKTDPGLILSLFRAVLSLVGSAARVND